MLNREKRIAKEITKLLNKRGFMVKQHKSKSSKSIYLKLDNGAIPSIRISDHKKYSKDSCKFNVIRNYDGARSEIVEGKIKNYYHFNSIGRLISDIEVERSSKIILFGYSRYRAILEGKAKRKTLLKNVPGYLKSAA